MQHRRIFVFFSLVTSLVISTSSFAAPNVVTSIKPIDDLVRAVMDGVGEPTRLIPPGSSPHTYALKPSERQAAEKADIFIWIGPSVETSLEKVTQVLPQNTTILTLSKQPDMLLLPARTGGDWERKPRATPHHHDSHADEHKHDATLDGHIWLAPANAKVIVQSTAETLSQRDPEHAKQYQANAEKALQRLNTLDAQLKTELASVQNKPFIVFHDAYHYLEHSYDLKAAGSIAIGADSMASAKRVNDIRNKIKTLGATCVFAEPQFEPKLVNTLVEGTNARIGTLDPLGANLPQGLGGYEQLMRNLAGNLEECLID
ncbi:MAG: zinc ABC transporter substrate-binding protein [Halothiobacillaceae bacterium]